MDADFAARASTVREARQRLGNLSEEKFYQLVNTGELETFTIGKRRYVSHAALARFISHREHLETEQRRREIEEDRDLPPAA